MLLTSATGFLGRLLALEWLERMDLVDGRVICLVRAKSNDDARRRLDATFDSGDPQLLLDYQELATKHLEVLAGDKGEANLGLNEVTWQRLADTVDLIVDPAALVNHVLPYGQLFGPNVVGTAELIRIALTTKIKPFLYVSTIAVGNGIDSGANTEDADVRIVSATRNVDDSCANGYGNSKWGGEVLLREANERYRAACRGVPLRHDPRRAVLRRPAQPAGPVHPVDHYRSPPGSRRRRSMSWAPTANGSGRTTTGSRSTSSPRRSRHSVSRLHSLRRPSRTTT